MEIIQKINETDKLEIESQTKENINELKRKFEDVKSMGWIVGNINNTGSAGIIFERLIGKERNDFEIPDYDNIEIKTKNIQWLERDISLFCAAPDNELLETERILEKYGKENKKMPGAKTFSISLDTKYKIYNNKYLFKLFVDKRNEKITLKIYDRQFNLIEKKISWSFEMLKEKLIRKFKYLALIYYESQKNNGQIFFNYKEINFYQLIGFTQFIDLLEKGKININFKVYTYNGDYRYGKMYNHGTSFTINIESLDKLFKKII